MAHAKFEAIQNTLESNENAPGVIKIAVNTLDKDEKDEVWYQHKLYDVVRRKSVGDASFVYILHDDQEEQLLADNYNYFRDDNGIFCPADFKIPNSKKTISLPDYKYVLPGIQKKNISCFTSPTLTVNNEYYSNHFNIEVPTPPPKL
jgi:hypothetical protein